MLQDTTLAFIGAGVMGGAMIRGILAQKMVSPEKIIASDPMPDRRQELHRHYGIQVTADNQAAVRAGQIVVLSIKPQMLPRILPEIRTAIDPHCLVVSIIAGAPVSFIQRELGVDKIIRAIPNTPSQVGQGMTVWTATEAVGEAERHLAQAILEALGRESYVAEESDLDRATAISGSGPAYIFLFMEALIDAGVQIGLGRRTAQELVYQTISGSVAMAHETGLHPAELRNQVTSPGGATAAALGQLEKGGLRTAISEAVQAAYQRARSLGELTQK